MDVEVVNKCQIKNQTLLVCAFFSINVVLFYIKKNRKKVYNFHKQMQSSFFALNSPSLKLGLIKFNCIGCVYYKIYI